MMESKLKNDDNRQKNDDPIGFTCIGLPILFVVSGAVSDIIIIILSSFASPSPGLGIALMGLIPFAFIVSGISSVILAILYWQGFKRSDEESFILSLIAVSILSFLVFLVLPV